MKNENYVLSNQPEYFVMGLPLLTEFGVVRPIKVKEYPKFQNEIEILKMQDWEIKDLLKKKIRGQGNEDLIIETLKNSTLLTCIQTNVGGLRVLYNNIFSKIVENYDDKLFLMRFRSQAEFDSFRVLLLDYNRISYTKWNPNPEIRAWEIKSLFMKKSKGVSIDFDSIFTSLCCVGLKPHDLNDLTICQFYGIFKRLELFKSYDTATLYKTVDAKDSIKVEEWFKSTIQKEADTLLEGSDALRDSNAFMKSSK